MLRVLDMKYNIIYRNPVLGRFFHGSGFSGSGTDFGRSGSRHKKKFDPDPGKKNRIRNTGFKFDLILKKLKFYKN